MSLIMGTMERSKFKHTFSVTVRNYEIDWQGIVHNGNYLLYFEVARVDYFKQVGMDIDQRTITGKTKIVVVRNEFDYLQSATFGDILSIRTRIVSVNTSSIRCEAEMLLSETGMVIARNVCILVWLNPEKNISMPVPEYFRKKVEEFEQGDATVQWPATNA